MKRLSPEEKFDRFLRMGSNSSHFVWLLDSLEAVEASNGWVFGYHPIGDVTLFALEPLIPGSPGEYSQEHLRQFELAWDEFEKAIRPKISAFVAVYGPFSEILAAKGFARLPIGNEPWMDLSRCIPRGNSGKGVRSARNQALRKGLRVEKIDSSEITKDSKARREIESLCKRWNQGRLLALRGFLNAADPFAHAESRRYFVVRNAENRAEGYLIATPIPGIESYFLEDLIIAPHATSGAGELLTLEAMMSLHESGTLRASLGVVSVLGVDPRKNIRLRPGERRIPPSVRFLVSTLPHLMRRLYNFDGLATFRRRFLPESWETVYLCVRSDDTRTSETRAWMKTLFALLIAFRPRIQFSFQWLMQTVQRPLRKYPVTLSVGAISVFLFGWINRFAALPSWALDRLAFDPSTPVTQWLYRSVISDFLYFDRAHFLVCAVPLLALIAWAERTHTRRFVFSLIAFISIFDDFLSFGFVIKPFEYFEPRLFQGLITMSDVGGSLWLAGLAGVQLCRFRRNREIIFASICLISVFGFAYGSHHMRALILNLNHFLFLSIGFIVGKVHFELERRKSRAVAKGKPPQAKCVLPSTINGFDRQPARTRIPESH